MAAVERRVAPTLRKVPMTGSRSRVITRKQVKMMNTLMKKTRKLMMVKGVVISRVQRSISS